jgi:hypothetical protein
VGDEVVFDA